MQERGSAVRPEPARAVSQELRRRGVGPVLARFQGVRKIAVLRGGGLGDLMFALPAVDALAEAYPEAEIVLLGTPAHAALLRGRPGPVDRVEVLPFAAGVRPGEEEPAVTEAFCAQMRAEAFDLAVQVHGGGRNSNPFLLRLGAGFTVGTRTPDAVGLTRTIPYVYYQHEVFRALEVVNLAGAVPVSLEPQLAVTAAERRAAAALHDAARPLVTIHPGATDPRRRWPAASFADVAARAAAAGCEVLVVGDETDKAAAEEIVQLACAAVGNLGGGHRQEQGHAPDHRPDGAGPVRSLAGELDLSTLVGVLHASAVMVGNDSGPRHLAQAAGTPTVGVYWFGNVINAGAMGRTLHRVHMSWTSTCPVCGIDVTQVGWTAERCEHDDSFVAGVRSEGVWADVEELLEVPPELRR